MRQIFILARQQNILTISELPDISQSESVVNFINKDNKIKFQISRHHACSTIWLKNQFQTVKISSNKIEDSD